MKQFPPSELIINSDGSIFHLHLRPEQLADKVILVGDPERVSLIASFFESIECEASNREFHSITGSYRDKRITVVSTGIGTDNCDIVVNELDALANIDLGTRKEKETFRQLTLVRIGTSGGLQSYCPVSSFVISRKSIGFDGLLHFYAGSENVRNREMEAAFLNHMQWPDSHNSPYIVEADSELADRIAGDDMINGVTISANGFYGPQGRELRIPLADPEMNEKISSFVNGTERITNFEMESSAIAGLCKLLGHKAVTVCCIIANRIALNANSDYKPHIGQLIETVLNRI